MEWISIEQKSGYTIYTNPIGENYLVLNGLDPNQIHTPGVIETFLTHYYAIFATAYWVLIILTLAYLCVVHLYRPLRKRYYAGVPLFTDE